MTETYIAVLGFSYIAFESIQAETYVNGSD